MIPRAEWKNYRAYLMATKCHMRDAGTSGNPSKGIAGLPADYVSLGELRSFMSDHPVWGVAARPELRDKLAEIVTLPHGWDVEIVMADSDLICRCIGAPSHSWNGAREFIELWGPGGPLEIGDEAWRDDIGFRGWWEAENAREQTGP